MKKISGLLKQHYEKVLLAVSLLLLVGAVVVLFMKTSEAQAALNDYSGQVEKKTGPGIPPIDLRAATNALAAARSIPTLDFSPPHNLIGPIKWQRQADGSILKVSTGREIGPSQVRITRITPMEFKLSIGQGGANGFNFSLRRESATNAFVRYWSTLAATNPSAGKQLDRYVGLNQRDPSGTFALREVTGAPAAAEVTVELLDSGEKIKFTKEKPFQRVEGYRADLAYPLESKVFPARRVGDLITISGEDYIVVDISADGVVLSARSNGKEHKIRFNPNS